MISNSQYSNRYEWRIEVVHAAQIGPAHAPLIEFLRKLDVDGWEVFTVMAVQTGSVKYEVLCRKLAFVSFLDRVDDVPPERWKDASRASGTIPCNICGRPLNKHYQPAKATCPTLVIDCEGNWCKL